MKNLTNVKKSSMTTNVLKFQGFERLTRYELGKIRGGDEGQNEPIIYPE
ncbi:MAG: hypothetical protein JW723_00130 [Bacteroidales bacterium]|nr:hypothetical protein [Bacteroidales bacterium]